MKIVSLNVGLPRQIFWSGDIVETGIFKEPVDGPLRVDHLNLAGDRQADLTVHGGVNKAVYGYPSEHYSYWEHELSTKLKWGAFGENLTTEGLSEESLCIGDQLRVGTATFVVTQPRQPCYKLQIRFEREDMIKRFLLSGRSGFYFKVVEPGELSKDSTVECLKRDENGVSIADLQRLFLGHLYDEDLLHRALNVEALPKSWKETLKQKAAI